MKMNRILAACGAALAVCSVSAFGGPEKFRADLPDVLANAQDGELVPVTIIMPVSYTHLTLPTNREV